MATAQESQAPMANQELPQLDRHCAYCLKFMPSGTWKQCAKCHRRPYCSKDCQTSDWKPGRGSQGHKNWCGLQCGEEDLDWEVKPVAGKGLGIIAKRVIPAKYRIVVEAIRSLEHPGVNDLVGDTLEEKVHLNSLSIGNPGLSCLCLRISRVNHDCDPNASHIFDETHQVKVLYSERAIQAGEEITISYTGIKDISYDSPVTPIMSRLILQSKWGIVCQPDCVCRNPVLARLVAQGRQLDGEISELAATGNRMLVDRAMQKVRQLLEIENAVKACLENKARTMYDGFQVGVMKRETFEQAKNYMRTAYDIQSSIMHPNSQIVLKWKGYLDDPSTFRHYLYLDRGGNANMEAMMDDLMPVMMMRFWFDLLR